MKETEWRSKLVRLFKLYHPNDFIWAMDAKFKAGFPDLYIIFNKNPYHIELKVVDKFPINKSTEDLLQLFAPLQLSVMRSINKAGTKANGLVLDKSCGDVWLYYMNSSYWSQMIPEKFKSAWCEGWLFI